ncbi:C2H2 type zinc finger domain-containing protein [Aaosphaeria arxii CBS 175.79]|uniref:C2H2 type zinc finger domain-containing protein n=1 Tax=Aaosphaeria arxii CBS 175.79 TaxID=1450172 RepID=A0A6A5YCT3_9PLEO|nr:C2H2 type zinc finger domain-containing protein [Aaosphaeria arxii CBS 175.79]KAF2022404.1 C2H2 type zinc finger domain-containing protein [Aaosphaeria arxii CBS 175.79]
MIPDMDVIGPDSTQLPPTLTTWIPEADWLGAADLFATEFAPTIDQTFETQQVLDDFFLRNPPTTRLRSDEAGLQANNQDEEARKRHAIFQRSPWLWVPGQNQNAFSEHDGPLLDEQTADIAASPHDPVALNIPISDQLTPRRRDQIFQLVSKTAQSQIFIPSFPSNKSLDRLIKVGIAKRAETDAWIHPFTFCSETALLEFLTALVAAGCVCFGIPTVNKTGLVLQEITRVALHRMSELDISTIRDLQYLQASMIWLDIGAFCGYRRKMEIAESNLQPLVTALRRAGKLDHVSYVVVEPNASDSEEVTDRKWRQWVEQESYKRLVYHLYEHDMSMTLVKHRNPLISYSELRLPLPATRNLWLAPSAEEWKMRWLSEKHEDSSMSLAGLLQDEISIRFLSDNIDVQVARSAYLYGLAAQIWDHVQQAAILPPNNASCQLWLQSRQQQLDQSLRNAPCSLGTAPAITCVLHQFLSMFLHVNLDTIARFAGKCGEVEARHAYARLQPWSQTAEARTAIWHAGQVLCAARSIPSYQIRGPDSFMVYHAVMVLWTYSMMMRARARRTGSTTPLRGDVDSARAPTPAMLEPLFLDGLDVNKGVVDAFILQDKGRPCLHITSPARRSTNKEADQATAGIQGICDLRSPSQIMRAGVSLLENTHPDVERAKGPPLLRALCGLMEELGNLR